MKNFLLLLALSSFPALAQDVCNIAAPATRTIKLPRSPNYFFKMSPGGQYLYYIADMSNWVIDTETGKETKLPGRADPVPSPDGKILTFLDVDGSTNWGVGVVPLDSWTPPKTPGNFVVLAGVSYQSVTSTTPGKYKMFYFDLYTHDLVVRDVDPLNKKVPFSEKRSLKGQAGNLRLPMLSPDGKFFSALNTDLNKTQIYSVTGDTIKLVETLPISAGKTSFSPDNSKLTFHLTRTMSGTSTDIQMPQKLDGSDSLRNVYVYDRTSKKIQPVTNNSSADSYYPIFLKDNKIAYVNSDQSSYSITISPMPTFGGKTLAQIVDCYGPGAEEELSVLADNWNNLCKKWQGSGSPEKSLAVATALVLPVSFCLKTATESGDADLMNLCRAMKGEKVKGRQAVRASAIAVAADPGKQVFQNKCAICHQDDEQKIMNSPNLMDRLTGKVQPSMPMGGRVLAPAERELLFAYLKAFRK